jgi:hypothetical protein
MSGVSMSDGDATTRWLNRIALTLPWIILSLAGCAGPVHFNVSPAELSVEPSSAVVAAGSTTAFTAAFALGSPEVTSLTWSVIPANGGTITNEGVYTASATAGLYTVVATWTSDNAALGGAISGSAKVEVLPVPQIDAELDPNFVQASGTIQTNGAIQNSVIAGQPVPSENSTDPNGDIQVRSGFTPPVPCAGSNISCQ